MSRFGYMRDSEFVLSPQYNTSSIISPHCIVLPQDWENDYLKLIMNRPNNKGSSIPRPGVYKNQPVFYGEFKPLNCPDYDSNEQTVIFSLKDGYQIVNFDDVNPPNNHQYYKYFHPVYTSRMVMIKEGTFKKRGRVVYLVIKNTEYQDFNFNRSIENESNK